MSIGAKGPQGVANSDPRGVIGRTYVGDHLSLIHAKYPNSGPSTFREEDFFKDFPVVSIWGLLSHRGVANFDPSGMVGRIYVE